MQKCDQWIVETINPQWDEPGEWRRCSTMRVKANAEKWLADLREMYPESAFRLVFRPRPRDPARDWLTIIRIGKVTKGPDRVDALMREVFKVWPGPSRSGEAGEAHAPNPTAGEPRRRRPRCHAQKGTRSHG